VDGFARTPILHLPEAFPWQTDVVSRVLTATCDGPSARHSCRSVLVCGAPGCGKSTLPLMLAGRMSETLAGVRVTVLRGGTVATRVDEELYKPGYATHYDRYIHVLDEVEANTKEESNTNGVPVRGKLAFNRFMDAPPPYNYIVGTTNRALDSFEAWFRRRFDLWVEVQAGPDLAPSEFRVHVAHPHGVLDAPPLYKE
ncbi:MAG TPA: AAA family ATPase, partial [Ramlibacter sp.]|nr:AAA family ATPase [Ramlibacter sp.]